VKKCDKCGDYIFDFEKHHCEPFTIINCEDGDESVVYGKYEEDAIERYAREYNEQGDYCLMGSSILLKVNDTKYRVGAESSVEYHVNEEQDEDNS